MSPWLLALIAGIALALLQYGRRAFQGGGMGTLLAALRTASIALIVALLLDAPIGRAAAVSTWAAIDGSLSMARGDSTLWRAARDTVRALHADSVLVFGDSVRRADLNGAPRDLASLLRPAAERALGAGHPLVVVTDGELDDADAAHSLPGGSRFVVLPHAASSDLAVKSVDVPRAAVSGDTVSVRVDVVAGSGGARAGKLTLLLDDRVLATTPVDSLAPFADRTAEVKVRLDGMAGPMLLRAAVSVPSDAEPHNDTLAVAIDLSRAATAVFVSTSPDFDARYALAVLRGALAIPTRGFLRVAPGEWRVEGALTPVSEAAVRQALRDAPVAIMHGDTAAFGPPRAATNGPLALVVTTGTDGEWYASAAPPSPIAPALSGFVWDSLPPVGVAATPMVGTWTALEARRGRAGERRAIVVGTDVPRRVVIVGASGLWRWRFRGGVAADAFTALWGSIFDWLAAERADRRAAIPDERVVRAGDPIRWRRGTPADSIVPVTVRRRGSDRVDSLTLRFDGGASVIETPAMAAGVYDLALRGGAAVLVVNPSREWLPRPPAINSGAVQGAAVAGSAPRLRTYGWPYVLVVLLLCAEWILRRRRGMR